jgi:hypothetical protein
MAVNDFLLDENGDLLIKDGDFVIGESDSQHVFDIITSFIGEWKQYPNVGVGIMQYLKAQNPNTAANSIKQQLQADGYSLNNCTVKIDETGNLKISFPNGIERNG